MAEEESFKVTDRRGWRGEASAPEPAAGPASPMVSAPGDPRGGRAAPSDPLPGESLKPDLQALFVMFASTALINLGEGEDPATGEPHVDIEQAREAIDVLLLLRDKTEGNRTDLESRLLEQILYDLQIRFVDVAGKRDRS